MPTHTRPGIGRTPISPVLFSHPAVQPDVADLPDVDLRHTRRIRFSAAPSATPTSRGR